MGAEHRLLGCFHGGISYRFLLGLCTVYVPKFRLKIYFQIVNACTSVSAAAAGGGDF
jgi:hypothetical protein